MMYVGPPTACRTTAPANSAATSPSDMSMMLDVVVGASASARKIAVPPFEAKISEKRGRAREQTCRFLNGRHRAGWRTQSGRKHTARTLSQKWVRNPRDSLTHIQLHTTCTHYCGYAASPRHYQSFGCWYSRGGSLIKICFPGL